MKNVELLSPVGDFDCLKAAVQNGADSVYLGANLFSARANARNFNLEQLKMAIEYAKIRNVKTYLTLNTLITNNEFGKAVNLVQYAYKFGIDAVIVQDLGLAKYLINNFPDLPIHSSTQMTTYNLDGVLELEKLGFKRVVLSREINLSEIKNISNNSNIELETFIHGALCISYSGQCLFSSMIGGRSGNRGKCAQPCRLPYKLKQNNKFIDSGYLLSTKDLCGLEFIPELINLGVTSFKIEGRMKPPLYVAIVTSIYRKYIDLALLKKPYIIDEKDRKMLLLAFNRGGFSTGYFNTHKENTKLIFKEKPNNMGLFLGKINNFNSNKGIITLKLNEDVSLGDTISIEKETGYYTISELIKDNKNSNQASSGDIVKIGRMKGNISVGDKIYKISDKNLTTQFKQTYSSSIEKKKIYLNCKISVKINEPIHVEVYNGNKNNGFYNEFVLKHVSDIIPTLAVNFPITAEKIIEQFSKTKNTPYEFNNTYVDLDDNAYISKISDLNELRRTILKKVEYYILEKNKNSRTSKLIEFNQFTDTQNNKVSIVQNNKQKISILLNKLDLNINYLNLNNIDNIYIPLKYFNLSSYTNLINELSNKFNIYIYFPIVLKNTNMNLNTILEKFNITGFVISNISQLYLLKKYNDYEFIGNYTLNVFNDFSIKEFSKLKISKITFSPELSKSEINNISTPISTEIIAYGTHALMTMNYCLIGESNKCYNTCNLKCDTNSNFYLNDRLNLDFEIIQDKINSVTTIYNSKITSINTSKIKVNNLRVDFMNETLEQMQNIIDIVKSRKKLEGKNYTNGRIESGSY